MSHTIIGYMESDTDTVAEVFACPECRENRIDRLVWQTSTYDVIGGTETSAPYVVCANYGYAYRPGETED